MKYHCRVCQISVGNRTPEGYIDHIRGAKHQRAKNLKIHPTLSSLTSYLVEKSILSPEEKRRIDDECEMSMDTEAFRAKISNILYGSGGLEIV